MRLLLFFSATRASLLNRESRSLMIVTCQLHSVRRYVRLCRGCTTFGLEMGKKQNLLSDSVRFVAKPVFWFCSFLLDSGSFPSLIWPRRPGWRTSSSSTLHMKSKQYMHKTGSKTAFQLTETAQLLWWGALSPLISPISGDISVTQLGIRSPKASDLVPDL